MDKHDLIVSGGGPQGLVHAVRAAKAGARVKLLDARPYLGGRLGTAETWGKVPLPAFRSVATAQDMSALRVLGLDSSDLGWAPAEHITAVGRGGTPLTLPAVPALARRALDARTPYEAQRWQEFTASVARMNEALTQGNLAQVKPANRKALSSAAQELVSNFDLPKNQLRHALALWIRPLSNQLASMMTDPLAQAALAGPSLFCGPAGPGDAGSLLQFLHGPLSDASQPRLDLGFVRDEFLDATPSLLSLLHDANVDVGMGMAVTDINVEKGRVTGITLADGSFNSAALVASSLDLKATALGLLEWSILPGQLGPDIGAARSTGGFGRIVIQLGNSDNPLGELGRGPIYLNTEPRMAAAAANTCRLNLIADHLPMECVVTPTGEGAMLSVIIHFLPQSPIGGHWTPDQVQTLFAQVVRDLKPFWSDIDGAIKHWRFDSPDDFEAAMGWSHGCPFGVASGLANEIGGDASLATRLQRAIQGLSFGHELSARGAEVSL